nr:hypothetical protein KitaXyl93_77300 [Kitasatospora sp. Xyl93]
MPSAAPLQTTTHSWNGCTTSRGAPEPQAIPTAVSRTSRFPPLTNAEVEQVERQLGYQLPPLLRRIYTEIGDGGFGPEGGLASLTPRHIPYWHRPDWPCATSLHTRGPKYGRPPSWLFLTGGGCSMQWHVSLIAIDNPVLLWDADGWEPDWGENPHDGLCYAAPSLRQWLWTWADGGNVWDEALKII